MIKRFDDGRLPSDLVYISETFVLYIRLPFPCVERWLLQLNTRQSTSLIHPHVIPEEHEGYDGTSSLCAHNSEFSWAVLWSISTLKRLRADDIANRKTTRDNSCGKCALRGSSDISSYPLVCVSRCWFLAVLLTL
jgi:hypothetical protein